MNAPRRKRTPTRAPVSLTPETEAAYAICYSVYLRGCECRERARGQVCERMEAAARSAAVIFNKRVATP